MHGSIDQFATRLLKWYDKARRNLPWRLIPDGFAHPDAYHVLVSELMLQQTQVATVIPYFHRFLERLPTIADLAAADEQEVLRLWQGLGYYSRARNLHRAAKAVMTDFGGVVPSSVEALLTLPGIGRYTAGAIASIAFSQRAPILDGNVMRVLCRIDAIETDPRERLTQQQLWLRAEELLPPTRCGDFNSALMELGATVCTPRSPSCLVCPVSAHCQALSHGIAEKIPPAKKTKPTPIEKRVVLCISRGDRWLIEQRPATGRWAGMWQFVTRSTAVAGKNLDAPLSITKPMRIGRIEHQLTHRRYQFDVRRCQATDAEPPSITQPHAWIALAELPNYPLPKPHLMVAKLLAK